LKEQKIALITTEQSKSQEELSQPSKETPAYVRAIFAVKRRLRKHAKSYEEAREGPGFIGPKTKKKVKGTGASAL